MEKRPTLGSTSWFTSALSLFLLLFFFASANTVSAQCALGVNTSTYDASTLVLGVRTQVSAVAWGNEYVNMTNCGAGNTYRFDACGTSYDSEITVHNAGVGIAFDASSCTSNDDGQLDLISPISGTLTFQVNLNGCASIATNSNLYVTLVTGGCTDPTTPSITPTSSTIACGASTTLNWAGATLNDATNWHIYTGGCGTTQLTSQPGTSLVVSPTVTTTYNIRGEDGAGCVDESTGTCGSVTITVNPLGVTFTALGDLCIDAGNQPGLGSGSPTGGVYSGTGVTDNGNGVSYSFNPATAGAGTHTITYTIGGACPGSANDNIVVFPLPTVTFAALGDLCLDAGNQTNQTGGSPAGGVYSGTGVTDAGDGINYTFDPAAAGVGTHTITYNFTDGNGCSGSANDNVVVFGLPAVTFAALGDLCLNAGNQTGLTGGSPAGGVYSGPGVVDDGNGITYSFNPATAGAGTHTITYNFTDGNGCSGSANDNVVVFAVPTVTFTALADLCLDAGTQTGLTGGSPTGGVYSGPGVTDVGDGINYSFDPAAAGAGTHIITYNFTDGNSCTGSANDNVVVFGLPTVTFAALGDLCLDAGNQTNQTGGSPAGGVYSGTGVTDAGDGINYTFDPAAAGVGTHTITYNFTDGNGCSGSANDNVVVFGLPTVSFAALGDLCVDAGNQTGLTGGSPAGGVYSGPGVVDDGNGITYSFNPAFSGVGTHTITYNFTDGNGCSGSANDNVVVFAVPTVTFTALADLCLDAGTQTGLTGGSPTGGVYSGPGVTDVGDGINYSFDPAAAGAGTHTITYSFTDGNSCTGSANDAVIVTPLDNAGFTYSAPSYCLTGTNPTPTITGFTPGTFSSTVGLVFASTSTGEIDLAGSTPGVYTVTYTTAGPCPNSSGQSVTINTVPVDPVVITPLNVCPGADVIITATGSGAGDIVFYDNTFTEIGRNAMPPALQTFNAGALANGSYTFYASEDNGSCESGFATINVVVGDAVAPTAVCQDITAYIDGTGNATISPNDLDGGATDNCGTVIVTASQTAFTCADVSTGPAPANDMVISGLIDGPLVGGMPKAIELYVIRDIADLSQYGVGSANNGGGSDGEEFTFPAVAVIAGTYIYLTIDSAEFSNFFGFAPDYTHNNAPLINGDDAVELFFLNSVIDVFGDINLDGTGQPWEYQDGWAYRNVETGPDGSTFQLGSWSFSGTNAIDSELTNATAAIPFPTATFTRAAGPVAVTVTFDDGNGNSSNCVANVTVSDTISPTIACPGNQTENPDASCNFTLPDYTSLASALDNCGTATITQSPAATAVISGTTTITMTADDGNGNTSTCQFDVVLNDSTAPTAVCQPISVYLNGAGTVTILASDLDGGSTDNCSGLTFTATQTTFTCADLGTVNVTLTVTDGNTNTATCAAVVTVLDTISPTAVCQPINAYLNGAGTVTINDGDINGGSSDNCTGVSFSASITSFTCAEIGANNVTLTVTDGSSNTATCVAVVTVIDTVSPVITCPSNQTQMADASCDISLDDYTGMATATDNCGSATVTQSPAPGTIVSGAGTSQTVTLTATDGSGNSAFCTFAVIVVDTISPAAVCQPITVYLNGGGTVTIAPGDLDGGSSDNCGGVTFGASVTAFNCADLGTNSVTLTVTDGSSNTATCVGVVTVMDTISPVASCPGNQTETPNASCQFVLPDYTILGSATDNCGGTPVITQSPAVGTTISGTTTITLTADDGNGNTSTCQFDVVLNDAVPPTAVCQNITVYLDAAGTATILDSDLDGGSSDNCSGLTFSASQTTFTCADIGTVSDTLIVTDGNSNVASCIATVTVMDTIAPTVTCPGNDLVTVDANCDVVLADYTTSATATDVCDASPVLTQSPAAGTTLNGAATAQQVWIIATDASGNMDSCSFMVTLSDTTAPSITCPANDTVAADAVCQTQLADYTGAATVADNCDANPTVTQSPAAGSTISGSGTLTTVWLYASDVSGNVDSCSFTVLLADSVAPAIVCPVNDTVATDANCDAVLADYTSAALVLDNCDAGPTLTQNPAAGTTLSGSGTIQAVWIYVQDADGNIDSCSFNVVLADSTAPAIACPTNDTAYVDANCDVTLADYTVLATVLDNCDANPVVTQSPAAGTIVPGAVTTTITLTATDADGNAANCAFDVVGMDTIAPVITCLVDTTTCYTLYSFATPTATDNCNVTVSQIAGLPSGGPYPLGSTTNIFVATDASGNTDTCSFVVTIDAQPDPANAGPLQLLCDVTSATLTGNTPSVGTGTWTALNGGTIVAPSNALTAATGLTIGTYEFVWTITNGVCSSSDTTTVIIEAGPDASFTYTNNNGVVTFTPTTTGADFYLWEFGDGSSSAVESPSYNYDPGSYNACLTVTIGNCQEQTCQTIDITTSVVEHELFESFTVYPNPFRESATIAYSLDGDRDVVVRVVDMQGREVAELANGKQSAGEHRYDFAGDDGKVATGVYYVQLIVDSQVYTLRLIQLN